MKALPKPQKSIQDEDRLDFVRKMPCLIRQHGSSENWSGHRYDCSTTFADALGFVNTKPCEAHHIRRGANSGVGTKPDAIWTVPLCSAAHHEFHNLGFDSFEKKYGINLEEHRQRINREFEKLHPAPKLRIKRIAPAKLALSVRNCPSCRGTHGIRLSKINIRAHSVRFWCNRRQNYVEVER